MIYGGLLMIAFSGCRSHEAPGERARGRVLFHEHCVLCHGENADGRGQRREGLSGRPADFTSAAWRSGATADGVSRAIREGTPGTSMPAWRSLDDREVADLTAHVLSVQKEGP